MNDLNQRLREERNRLGLTQEDFARSCGVGRRAQAAYEAGERVPDATYLMAAAKIGVDTRYLLSGFRRDAAEITDYAIEAIFRSLCSELRVPDQAVEETLIDTRKVLQQNLSGYGTMQSFEELAKRLLSRSSRLNEKELTLELNSDTLVDIIRELEISLIRLEARNVSSAKKALTICRLYRIAAEQGELDLESVRLSAQNLNSASRGF